MTSQIIGNVLVIELTPEDKAKTIIEQICCRYEKQIVENNKLNYELQRIKEQQKLMQFAWQG